MKPVIVLGVNTPIGLAVLRDLSQHGYYTIGIGSLGAIGHASKHCHHKVIRATTKELVIDQLIAVSKKFEQPCLLAISETDITLINQYRDQLNLTIKVLVPPAEQMAIVLDKSKTLAAASEVGIECPTSLTIDSIAQLDSIESQIIYPVVLKWANPLEVQKKLSQQGLKLHKLEFALTRQQLRDKLSVYEGVGQFPLIQQYCHGVGLGQFFLCKDGEVHLEFQHIREHEWPPEGGTSTRCRSLDLSHHQACLAQSRALLKKINWQGVAMVEYRYCREQNQYILMEINGRFWGSLALSYHSGVNFASALVELFNEKKSVKQCQYRQVSAIYMIPELRRLHRVAIHKQLIKDPVFIATPIKDLLSLLTSYVMLNCHYFVFSWRDPGPFIKDMKNVAAKVLGRR